MDKQDEISGDGETHPPYVASAATASAPPPIPPETPVPVADRSGVAIFLMCLACLIFAVQDGFSRVLGENYPPLLVVMIRFWVFALFVMAMVSRAPGGIRRAARTKRPFLQVFRGVLLAAETVLMVEAFVQLGLVETHAIFTVYPLLVAALSGPVLGEKVGWRRWAAIGVGFAGILVILQPGGGVMQIGSLLPFGAALMFALYGLLTRLVSRDDPSTVSFFWTGVSGAVAMTLAGIWQWEWLAPRDWLWMAGLCLCGITSHYLLIRAYELAEASVLQPFAYSQLAWASIIGLVAFGDVLRPNVVAGAVIIVAAGIFTLWRQRQKSARHGLRAGAGR